LPIYSYKVVHKGCKKSVIQTDVVGGLEQNKPPEMKLKPVLIRDVVANEEYIEVTNNWI